MKSFPGSMPSSIVKKLNISCEIFLISSSYFSRPLSFSFLSSHPGPSLSNLALEAPISMKGTLKDIV